MEKILTVSIAAYNVEDFIKQTLDSLVLNNTLLMNKLEVLIINDGSKDKTIKIAHEYVDKYPNTFKLINKDNGGWGSTLNYGFKYATGKYFKQLDGDDYFLNKNLSGYMDFLENSQADLIVTPFYAFDTNNGDVLYKKEYDFMENKNEYLFDEIAKKFTMDMHSCTVKTSILKDNSIKILEHCFYTDVEYMTKICSFVSTVAYCDMNIYCYRVARDGQSMSIQGVRKHYKDHIKVVFTLIEYIQTVDLSENIIAALENRLVNMINMQYMFFCLLEPNKSNKRELIEFDNKLKSIASVLYTKIPSKKTKIFRSIHFFGYRYACCYVAKKYK